MAVKKPGSLFFILFQVSGLFGIGTICIYQGGLEKVIYVLIEINSPSSVRFLRRRPVRELLLPGPGNGETKPSISYRRMISNP